MNKRLIEVAFPLKQTSLDSVHEKNVRHGHISTLHIWPARRPLAACRAALIATLLPDPGDDGERQEILERLGGHVVERRRTKRLPNGEVEETVREETEGGILHWGRESGPDLDWFREKIREAYGGRAPRVLDPFAGGAIPLEAMRLGCEATAVDINPVAWFILKCTLEYPQRLAGQTRPLPEFVLQDRDFMESFFKARGLKGASLEAELDKLGLGEGKNAAPLLPGMEASAVDLEADLAWHVRAWGKWILDRARKDLAPYYPVVDGRPTVAYLWARTVACKNCRATIPLLKTTWLCRKPKKRIVLTIEPNEGRTGVVFGISTNPARGKNMGKGTMSASGTTCPCCDSIMTMSDLRLESKSGHVGTMMFAVVVEGKNGKEYRLPTEKEHRRAQDAAQDIEQVFAEIPFGMPTEPTPAPAGSRKNSSSLRLYGLLEWKDLFTPRALLAMGAIVKYTRAARDALEREGYSPVWAEAVAAETSLGIDKLADYIASLCTWHTTGEKMSHVFVRFAFPVNWDFAELNPLSNSSGNYLSCIEWIARVAEHTLNVGTGSAQPDVLRRSSASGESYPEKFDLVLTDPPYYDAISYGDLTDFFYVWLRRTVYGLSPEVDQAFSGSLTPKWDHEQNDGELIDNPTRFKDDKERSRDAYEEGMFRVFRSCYEVLTDDGRMVIVFAHKNPDAWETLVSAIIRAGFVVDGSWPIQTEMGNRTRAQASAALSSSVWMVCKKRSPATRPGWDNRVLADMRQSITGRLRQFWDAGIRGPDFVWAATGPAMEAYSRYPVVKKANQPGETMAVNEFLAHVRRMVVDFVVGRVLSGDEAEPIEGLDNVTTYYLLHRHDFGLEESPASAAILYALSCGLSDRALTDSYRLLRRRGRTLQLMPWTQRPNVGHDPVLDAPEPSGVEILPLPGFELPEPALRELPLIDQVHRLMHLWRGGDVVRVDAYLNARGLRRSALFRQLLQALIELAPAGGEERALLESLSNHVGTSDRTAGRQTTFA